MDSHTLWALTILLVVAILSQHCELGDAKRTRAGGSEGKTRNRSKGEKLECGLGKHQFEAEKRAKARIYNGETTRPDDHPYVVQILKNKEWDKKCIGTFVDPEVVITAGSCIEPGNSYDIAFGSRSGDPHTVKPVYRAWHYADFHPNREFVDNDIAILFIERTEPTTQPHFINTICRLAWNETQVQPFKVAGWGEDESGQVQEIVKMRTVNTTPPKKLGNNLKCSEIEVPSEDRVFGPGDHGGPLMQLIDERIYLAGIMATTPTLDGKNYNCYMMWSEINGWVTYGIYRLVEERKILQRQYYHEIAINGDTTKVILGGSPLDRW